MSPVVGGLDLIAIGIIFVPPMLWMTAQIYSLFFSSEEVRRPPQKYAELVREKGGPGSFLWLTQRRHQIVRVWIVTCIPALIWSLGLRPLL